MAREVSTSAWQTSHSPVSPGVATRREHRGQEPGWVTRARESGRKGRSRVAVHGTAGGDGGQGAAAESPPVATADPAGV